jgi:hypothetical protein
MRIHVTPAEARSATAPFRVFTNQKLRFMHQAGTKILVHVVRTFLERASNLLLKL